MQHCLKEHSPTHWDKKTLLYVLSLSLSLFEYTFLNINSNVKHESSLKERSSLDVASHWEDINGRWLSSQMKEKWFFVSRDLASNELPAGLAVVKRRVRGDGGKCRGNEL